MLAALCSTIVILCWDEISQPLPSLTMPRPWAVQYRGRAQDGSHSDLGFGAWLLYLHWDTLTTIIQLFREKDATYITWKRMNLQKKRKKKVPFIQVQDQNTPQPFLVHSAPFTECSCKGVVFRIYLVQHLLVQGLPLWLSWQRILLQCKRPGFNPWVGKIPWRREGDSPVFWPG